MEIRSLEDIKRELANCEKLYYAGICILKENRILKKVLADLSKISLEIVYFFTKDKKFKDNKEKVSFFIKNHLSKNFSKEEIKDFVEILKFYRMHKESSLEFVRNEKLIIYFGGRYETISKEKIVNGIILIKNIIKFLSGE